MKSIRTFMTEKINESLSKEKLRNDWNRIWNAMENGMFIDMAFNFLANEGNLLKKFIERESEINALFAESISAGEEKRLRKEWGKLLNDMMYDEFAEQLYNFMDEATLARFIRFADGFMGESLNENEDAKIKELEKKLEKVEDKAEKAEDAAEDAEDKAKKADKEASKA